MKYVFDTSAFISLFNGEKGSRKVSMLLDDVERERAEGYISSVTLTEVYYNYARIDEKLAHQRIDFVVASKLKTVPADGNIALQAGKYKLKSIPLADAIIAATAYEYKAHLVADDKHFKELGLNIINYR
jgi:predicted nucleic acid-binding protein